MPAPRPSSLAALMAAGNRAAPRVIGDSGGEIPLSELSDRTNIRGGGNGLLRGKCVLLATADQLPTVMALVHLDGTARRVVICPPDITRDNLHSAVLDAEVDVIVCDQHRGLPDLDAAIPVLGCGRSLESRDDAGAEPIATEWLLFTSGTTGRPKLVRHKLRTLTAGFADGLGEVMPPPVWSTFYDIRRYGGLQILLRALAGAGSMILSDSSEAVTAFLRRAGAAGVTHISGTPSHWRRALMTGEIDLIAPRYVRLSGEAADQTILDALRLAFPAAEVAHAFASTEAGLAFDVRDGKAGFPASIVGTSGDVRLMVKGGTLHVSSERMAIGGVGVDVAPLRDSEGFIDTGDIVELRGDRFQFAGRRNDIINVGGLKVHPETVESVINRHPGVRLSRVSARSNPITGAIVVADVVFGTNAADAGRIEAELFELCHAGLARHEVPTSFRFVDSLPLSPSGKLLRRDA